MSVVIDFDSLLIDSGLETYAHNYRVGIRGLNSSGSEGAQFYGTQESFDNSFVSETVHFPYGSWQMSASEKDDLLKNQPWYRVNSPRIVGYPVLIFLCVAFVIIYRLYCAANEKALHDELTGLPNRRYFMYSLQHHFDSVSDKALEENFAVMNIDLDKFKSINDTYGHAAGDKVLIACAERISSVLRSSDLVARVGGDEFLIILYRISSTEDIDVISIELQKAIRQTPVIYEEHLINLNASIGYALYDGKFETIDHLLKQADERMYAEKNRQQIDTRN